jgi:hypothetical protein
MNRYEKKANEICGMAAERIRQMGLSDITNMRYEICADVTVQPSKYSFYITRDNDKGQAEQTIAKLKYEKLYYTCNVYEADLSMENDTEEIVRFLVNAAAYPLKYETKDNAVIQSIDGFIEGCNTAASQCKAFCPKTNSINVTCVINDIVKRVYERLAASKLTDEGYELHFVSKSPDTIDFQVSITHIGYSVPIIPPIPDKKDFLSFDCYQNEMLNVNMEYDDATVRIEQIIGRCNDDAAKQIVDQIKTHQFLKSFEKMVYDKYVVTRYFPSPEQMMEEFKTYYDAVKSVHSPISFPCTIADWWNHLEHIIKKNTAFWLDSIRSGDPCIRKEYNLTCSSSFKPDIFSVYIDMSDIMNADGVDREEKRNNIVLPFTNMYKNELNGIPAIVQTSIPTAQPQPTAV